MSDEISLQIYCNGNLVESIEILLLSNEEFIYRYYSDNFTDEDIIKIVALNDKYESDNIYTYKVYRNNPAEFITTENQYFNSLQSARKLL